MVLGKRKYKIVIQLSVTLLNIANALLNTAFKAVDVSICLVIQSDNKDFPNINEFLWIKNKNHGKYVH